MIDSQSLWIDEGWSIHFSNGSTISEVFNELYYEERSDRFHVLYYFFLYYWRNLFGSSEYWLRLPSALFGVLTIVVSYFTALRNLGKKAALISLLLVSTSSYYIYYSQEARDYSLLIFLSSLQVFLLLESRLFSRNGNIEKGNQASSLLFGFVTALSIFANITNVCFTTALAISHVLASKKIVRVIKWWLPALILSLGPLFFYLSSPLAASPESIRVSRTGLPIIYNIAYTVFGLICGLTYGPSQSDLKSLDKLSVIVSSIPYLILASFLLSILALILLIGFRKSFASESNASTATRFLFISLFLSFLFGIMLAILTGLNWLPRHAYYVWPILALLIPASLSTNRSKQGLLIPITGFKSSKVPLAVFLTCYITVNLISSFNYFFVSKYEKDNFREVASYVQRNLDSSTTPILTGKAGSTLLFSYYGSDKVLDGHIGPRASREDFLEKIYTSTNRAKNILLIVNREYIFPKDFIQKSMAPLYQLESQNNDFQYFSLYQYELK